MSESENSKDYFYGEDGDDQEMKRNEWRKKKGKKRTKNNSSKHLLNDDDGGSGEKKTVEKFSEQESQFGGSEQNDVKEFPEKMEDLKYKEDMSTVENDSVKSAVLYEEIKNDLRIITLPDEDLSPEEKIRRPEIFENLEKRGVKLPEISGDIKDKNTDADKNRQFLRGALEFAANPLLQNNLLFKDKREAIVFLKKMNIEVVEGAEVLPVIVGEAVNEESSQMTKHEILPEDTKREEIQKGFVLLAGSVESNNSEEIKVLKIYLERLGVKINDFMNDCERLRPGKSDAVMLEVGKIFKAWAEYGDDEISDPRLAKNVEFLKQRFSIE